MTDSHLKFKVFKDVKYKNYGLIPVVFVAESKPTSSKRPGVDTFSAKTFKFILQDLNLAKVQPSNQQLFKVVLKFLTQAMPSSLNFTKEKDE